MALAKASHSHGMDLVWHLWRVKMFDPPSTASIMVPQETGFTRKGGLFSDLPGMSAPMSGGQRGILIVGVPRLMRQCIAHALRTRFPCFEITETGFEHVKTIQVSEKFYAVLLVLDPTDTADRRISVLVEDILRSRAGPRTVVISSCRDKQTALSVLRSGFAGFFLADCGLELLAAAINLVLAGGRYIPAHLLPELCGAEAAMAEDA